MLTSVRSGICDTLVVGWATWNLYGSPGRHFNWAHNGGQVFLHTAGIIKPQGPPFTPAFRIPNATLLLEMLDLVGMRLNLEGLGKLRQDVGSGWCFDATSLVHQIRGQRRLKGNQAKVL